MIKKINENKKLKAGLFFGFYFFFFLFIALYIRNNGVIDNKEKINKEEEIIKEYSIKYLTDNNYQYHFIINDNDEVIEFNGTKEKIDYEEYPNKYFLDIYNINQIIKNSKYLNTENSILNYDISNITLSSLTGMDKLEGVSKISVTVNSNHDLKKVVLDLSSYMQKDLYLITLDYEVGEEYD